MKINKLSARDKEIFNRFLSKSRHELSVYAFENIYVWKGLFDIQWSVIENSLCVFFKDNIGCFLYLAPLSERNDPRVVNKAFEVMDSINRNDAISRIENVEEQDISFYKGLGYCIGNKSCDYLCKREDLVRLEGNRFKSKRACFNYFTKHYAFDYLSFYPKYAKECLRLYDLWAKERKSRNQERVYQGMLEDNQKTLKNVMSDYSDLSLIGRIIKINKKIKAFTFGFKLNQDTFCILYEIADLSIKGLSQFIFREFCDELKSYRYVNVMDDSGLENLRKVKLSYQPFKLIPSYIVSRKNE
ncbi:MAG: phosphatidylglycerol lysyltransferase domain-containing protein [Candidatus Omnitrophota bacterium]